MKQKVPKSAARGYIYAIISASQEGIIKIGASTNHPLERARQLSASTSAASPFVVAYHKHVAYPFQAESAIHKVLDKYRVNKSREFFRLPLHKVIEAFDRFDETPENRPPTEEPDLPWSWLFSSFPDDHSARELTADEQRACRELEQFQRSGKEVP